MAGGKQKYAFEIMELAKEISEQQTVKRAQEILYRFLHPPKWVLLILPPIVFAVLAHVLLSGKSGLPVSLSVKNVLRDL